MLYNIHIEIYVFSIYYKNEDMRDVTVYLAAAAAAILVILGGK
jgi:hypothetical protein